MALLAGGTLPARDGLYALDFVAGTGVLDKATDVDDAIVAGVGALEAGLVRLYGVVIVVMGVYPSRVHSSLVLSVGRVPGSAYSCGAISLYLATTLYYSNLQTSTNVIRYLL